MNFRNENLGGCSNCSVKIYGALEQFNSSTPYTTQVATVQECESDLSQLYESPT